jgi:hypothetical protein
MQREKAIGPLEKCFGSLCSSVYFTILDDRVVRIRVS